MPRAQGVNAFFLKVPWHCPNGSGCPWPNAARCWCPSPIGPWRTGRRASIPDGTNCRNLWNACRYRASWPTCWTLYGPAWGLSGKIGLHLPWSGSCFGGAAHIDLEYSSSPIFLTFGTLLLKYDNFFGSTGTYFDYIVGVPYGHRYIIFMWGNGWPAP